MTYLLDTNTCIRYLNGTSVHVRNHLANVKETEVKLCSVVKAELQFGALKSARPQENLLKLSRFLDRFVSLPFDDRAAGPYGEIRLNLSQRGLPIGANDLLIASIAMANRLTLVTHNTAEFGRVPGLLLVDWER